MVSSRDTQKSLTADQAAQGFAAVGSGPRLEVLRALVRAGPEGLSVGEIQERVGLPASTLAHHLRFLAEGGLVDQEKAGRSVINRAAFTHIQALASYLMQECCADAQISPHEHHKGLDLRKSA